MNILFDLDGTLSNPSPGFIASIRYALESLQRAVPPDEFILQQIGPPLETGMALLLKSNDPEMLNAGIGFYRQRYGSTGLFENSVYPGIEDCLLTLRAAGARLFVATSKPHVFANRILDHFKLKSHFDAVYGSEFDGSHANKSELIAHLLRSEKLDAASTLMIGDRYHDAVGARNNGITSVGVLWGFGSRQELQDAGVQFFCEEPAQLAALVLGLAAQAPAQAIPA